MLFDMVDAAILVNEEASVLAESMLDNLQRGNTTLMEAAGDPIDIDSDMVVDTYSAWDAPEEFDQIGMDASDYLEAEEDVAVGDGYGDVIDTMAGIY